MMRFAPSAVRIVTTPGCSAVTLPMTVAPVPAGCPRIATSAASAASRGDDGHQAPLVGDLDRVKPEEPARRLDFRRDGDCRLVERDPDARRRRDLAHGRAEAAAGRIAQHVHVRGRSHRPQDRLHEIGEGRRVRAQFGAELEAVAHAENRHAVHPDGTADDDRVAGRRPLRRELDSVVDDPDPGRRHVHPVPVAGLDDLRIARDELDAGGGRGRTHRRRNLLEHATARVPPRARTPSTGRADGLPASRDR